MLLSRFLFPLAIGLLLALPPLPALAQDPASDPQGVSLSFEPCFDDLGEPGWIPVAVSLSNKGRTEVSGQVRVVGRILDFDLAHAWRDVTLPPGANHRYFIYIYLPDVTGPGADLRVDFFRNGARRAEGSSTRPIPFDACSNVVVVGPNPALLNVFNSNNPTSDPTGDGATPVRMRVVGARAASLPDRWIGYERLEVLVLNDAPSTGLSEEQQAAILDWVRSGGTVLVSPGPDPLRFSEPLYRTLLGGLPVVTETVNSLPDLEALGRVPFEVRSPFVVHRPQGGAPLREGVKPGTVTAIPCGFGTVVFACFDLSRPPFAGWSGSQALWRALLKPLLGRNPHKEPHQPPNTFGWLARSPDARISVLGKGLSRLPSMLLLVLVIVLYLAAIGPVNYLLLRRYNLHLYTVVTIPAIAIVFVFLIVGLGYVTNGASTVFQRGAIVSVRSGEPFAHDASSLCLFSSAPRTYDLSYDELSNPHPLFESAESATAAGVRLEETGSFALRSFPLKLWEEGYFVSQALRPLPTPIQLAPASGGGWTVTNGPDAPLLGGGFVDTATWQVVATVGAVAAGASATGSPVPVVAASPDTLFPALDLPSDRFRCAFIAHALDGARRQSTQSGPGARPILFVGLLAREPARPTVNAGWTREGEQAAVLLVWGPP